jgi:hypothetical protein
MGTTCDIIITTNIQMNSMCKRNFFYFHSEFLGFWTLSIIRYCKARVNDVSETGYLFTLTEFRLVLSKGPNRIGTSLPSPHLRTETERVCETLCPLGFPNTGRRTESKIPAVLSVCKCLPFTSYVLGMFRVRN